MLAFLSLTREIVGLNTNFYKNILQSPQNLNRKNSNEELGDAYLHGCPSPLSLQQSLQRSGWSKLLLSSGSHWQDSSPYATQMELVHSCIIWEQSLNNSLVFLGPVHTKYQRQRAITLEILVSLKSMESLQNEWQPHSRATLLSSTTSNGKLITSVIAA